MRPVFDPAIAAFLEDIHSSCSKPSRLRRDPLAVVAPFPDPLDREVAGIVASTLAFGSVDLILRACSAALAPLGREPRKALLGLDEAAIAETWAGFQYRYCFSRDIVALLLGTRRALLEFGSLNSLFLSGDPGGEDVVAATGAFVRSLRSLGSGGGAGIRPNLLPDPAQGSACKRIFLFLRWMARTDGVDPGGWKGVDPSRLVVPMDTHMARVSCERLHFIPKPKADLRSALAVTQAFRLYAPEDPVMYDFALTRPGIDPEPGDGRFSCG